MTPLELIARLCDPFATEEEARGEWGAVYDGDGEPNREEVMHLSMDAVREINLPELLTDYDWGEVFGEGYGGNTDKITDACPPGASIDLTPPTREDVAEVIATVNGENEGAEWVGVFRLKDGRYLLASGSCDYTGWDCHAGNSLEVAATLNDILAMGLTEDQRRRLSLPDRC